MNNMCNATIVVNDDGLKSTELRNSGPPFSYMDVLARNYPDRRICLVRNGYGVFLGALKISDSSSIYSEERYYMNGVLHRDGDLPAVLKEYPSGAYWVQHGLLHRDGDKPAVIENICSKWYRYGSRELTDDDLIQLDGAHLEWFQRGKHHRDHDRPAVVTKRLCSIWMKNNIIQRDGDLPAEVHDNHSQKWYENGVISRSNGLPAVVYEDGSQQWYSNGVLHRDHGLPADISFSVKRWYTKGVLVRWTCNELHKPTETADPQPTETILTRIRNFFSWWTSAE